MLRAYIRRVLIEELLKLHESMELVKKLQENRKPYKAKWEERLEVMQEAQRRVKKEKEEVNGHRPI